MKRLVRLAILLANSSKSGKSRIIVDGDFMYIIPNDLFEMVKSREVLAINFTEDGKLTIGEGATQREVTTMKPSATGIEENPTRVASVTLAELATVKKSAEELGVDFSKQIQGAVDALQWK